MGSTKVSIEGGDTYMHDVHVPATSVVTLLGPDCDDPILVGTLRRKWRLTGGRPLPRERFAYVLGYLPSHYARVPKTEQLYIHELTLRLGVRLYSAEDLKVAAKECHALLIYTPNYQRFAPWATTLKLPVLNAWYVRSLIQERELDGFAPDPQDAWRTAIEVILGIDRDVHQ